MCRRWSPKATRPGTGLSIAIPAWGFYGASPRSSARRPAILFPSPPIGPSFSQKEACGILIRQLRFRTSKGENSMAGSKGVVEASQIPSAAVTAGL